MKNEKFDDISEEDFLKNKARRKSGSDKKANKKKKQKTNTSPVLKWFLIALAVILSIIAIVAICGAVYYFAVVNADISDDHSQRGDNFINSEGDEVNRLTSDSGNKKYYTFLATATDVGGSLTDVIMVARFHYDDKEPEISLLQIPRDTYIKISANKLHFTDDGALSDKNFSSSTATTSIKINEAFYRGKKLAEKTVTALLKEAAGKTDAEIDKILKKKDYVFLDADAKKVKSHAKSENASQKNQLEEDILRDFGLTYLQSLIYYNYGIPTDYHAQVNVKGFRGVVNAIDGIDLYVPQDMNYDDPFQDLHIHLKKGQQHLDGKKAEGFVRFRGYPEGDVARLDAQKLFIDAFLDKLLSFTTVTKIDDIITEIQSNLFTNISFNNMIRFANKLLAMDLKNDIHMYTLPGTGEYIGPVSYFVADRDETIKLVNEEFNVFNSPLIDEDFKMVDNKNIYRPVSTVPEDEESEVSADTQDESDENTKNGENDEEDKKDDTENVEDSEDSDSKTKDDKDEEDSVKDNRDDSEKDDASPEDITTEEDDKKDTQSSGKDKEPVKEDKEDKELTDESDADSKTSEDNEKEADTFSSEANLTIEEDENYKLLEQMAA